MARHNLKKDPPPRAPFRKVAPLPDGFVTFAPCAYVYFHHLARAKHHTTGGRTNSERYMDRRGRMSVSWHRTLIFPPAVFAHEVSRTRMHRCESCQKLFQCKRQDAKHCSARCRQAACRVTDKQESSQILVGAAVGGAQ